MTHDRQHGSTTLMLADAIAKAGKGERVLVMAAHQAQVRQLLATTMQMLRVEEPERLWMAGLDHIGVGNGTIKFISASETTKLRGSHGPLLVDHYAMQSGLHHWTEDELAFVRERMRQAQGGPP